mmetsp:Transcript_114158/g.170746  ORF Transcript_114158/g.170746 Transcript_114158/m.170746 type:complete len:1076 (-) Transcript_114158:51-3278(-)|eukprot:CAMPEP_0117045034 /NCGR_PEP_ID=MMETSP0472-20121206/31177_1 /TAXON_ID=693140 ORGANISM="Tiarina fusus, Strain LIS" /NCGR_SAMPLE_ID=MMETSP0472 /ASSEMBLY_ACC=CAM_ASM_000603 /LENGTH=1075 /DNA_ID=CAMNT_0004756925 /DNA_START=21 /DNA_END=3248 /DNA_ORIENTATION=+
MDLQACAQLIINSLNTNNEIRQKAEEEIESAKQNQPDQFLVSLCLLAKDPATPTEARLLSLIILRRSVCLNRLIQTPYERIQDATKEKLKVLSLEILQLDLSNPFKGHVVELLGNLATSVMKETSNWNDLIQLLAQWTQSPKESQRETALKVFSHLISCQAAPESFYDSLSAVFTKGLSDASANIRLASLEGSIQFLIVYKKFRESFKSSIPNAFEIVTACLNNNQEELAISALESLIQLAEIAPDVFEPFLDAVLEICLKISSQPSVDDTVRHSCLEIIITLGENKPSYLRHRAAFLQTFINLLLKMMTHITDNPDWNKGEEFDDEDEERDIGNGCLDRLALSIRAPVVAILFDASNIPAMLNHAEWKVRHTALIAISLVGEGCSDVMKENLDQVIQCILPSFKDPHERVRWAACNTIGQMATDFSPVIQKRYHQEILTSIAMVMGDSGNPRVQSYAAAAIINFCDECKSKIVEPYLELLLGNLLALLTLNSEIVVEQAIIATAAIAECVGKSFIPFYSSFMPVMVKLLNGSGSVDSLKIRGKAIEGIGLIAAAVGSSVFAPHCQDVMGHLLQLETSNLSAEDPRAPLLQRSWGRFSKALGKDFAPFLPPILPRILASAGLEADIKLLTDDQKEEENWQLIQLDKQNTLGINTTVIQEKSDAMTLLYWLSYELRELFFPYIQQILPICLDGLGFFYHDSVRISAASIIPCLLRATFAHTNNYTEVQNLFRYVFSHVLGAIDNELEIDVQLVFLDALQECFDAAGPNSTSKEDMKKFMDLMTKILENFSNQRKLQVHRMQMVDSADFAKVELEKQHEILIKVGEVVGKALETCGETALSEIGNVYQYFNGLLYLNEYDVETQITTCFFDDLVEFGTLKAEPLYKPWLLPVVELIRHPHKDVRQSVVYGLGVLAQVNPNLFAPVLSDVLNGLNQLISMEGSREDEHIHVTENAICAMGKIIQFHGASIDINAVLPVWLSYLPVTEDDETNVIYKQLCHFMVEHSSILVGPKLERLQLLLTLFVEIFGSPLIDDDTNPTIAQILKEMQTQFPANNMQEAYQQLNPEQQQKLQHIVSN